MSARTNTRTWERSIPGKLMIAGEYAVLEGAKAIVMAVDLGVSLRASLRTPLCAPLCASPRVHVAPSASNPSEEERTDQHTDQPDQHTDQHTDKQTDEPFLYRLAPLFEEFSTVDVSRGTFDWRSGPKETLLLLESIQHTAAELYTTSGASMSPLGGWSLTADTSQMQHQEGNQLLKLGLGSSAASCVALSAFVSEIALGHADLHNTWKLAHASHLHFQKGKGSGADVAASCWGGVIEYHIPSAPRQMPSVQSLPINTLPPWRAFWLKKPASTTSMLASTEALRQRDPAAHQRAMQQLADVSERLSIALTSADQSAALSCIAEAESSMDFLGREAKIPILTDAHRVLSANASSAGLVCKPSGAGGGDFSLVFGQSEEALDEFSAKVTRDLDSFVSTPLRVAKEGIS